MEKAKYFKGLNGIRAIASLIVVLWHADQKSYLFKVDALGYHKNGMAGNAVDMFFVLSGFLITYLLLVEKEKTKIIDFKKFYLRRIFRIWPLYYLSICISGVLIYFNIDSGGEMPGYSFLLYFFLLANVAYVLKMAISSITPLWSVGVEEQFYLIWPHIVKRTTKYLRVFISLIMIYLMVKVVLYVAFTPSSFIFSLLEFTRIDIMFLGAIGAYLVYSNHAMLKLIYRKEVQILSWLVLLMSIVYHPIHIMNFLDKEINAIFYFIIILNISSNEKSLLNLENKFFNFIGKISYGIYVYHMIIIYLLSYCLSKLLIEVDFFTMLALVVFLTIAVAWLSFKFFETPFLKIKNKYSVVKSTNSNPN
jgi:peptidoglycan/LPS O-acetylase OafA/YrhL